MPAAAPGVVALGVPVAGLTSEPARLRLERAFSRSIPVMHGSRRWWVSPERLGSSADIDAAVSDALDARPGERVAVHIEWSGKEVRRFVAQLAHKLNRP